MSFWDWIVEVVRAICLVGILVLCALLVLGAVLGMMSLV